MDEQTLAHEEPAAPEVSQHAKSAAYNQQKKLFDLIKQPYWSRSRPQIDAMLAQLERETPSSIFLYNTLLRANMLLFDADGIKRTLARIKEAGLSPNIYTYNILLTYYRNLGDIKEAERLFEELQARGIPYDIATLTTLVSGYAQKSIDKAETFFLRLREEFPAVDLHSFNAMIFAYVKWNKLDHARRLCDELKANKLSANFVTFKILLRGLVQRSHWSKALDLYEVHLADNPQMRIGDHSEVMELFSEAQRPELVTLLYQKIKERFGTLDRRASRVYLKELLAQEKYSEAKEILLQHLLPTALQDRTALQLYHKMIAPLNDEELNRHLLALIRKSPAEDPNAKPTYAKASKQHPKAHPSWNRTPNRF